MRDADVVVDTHVWIWLVEGHPRLPAAAVEHIEQAATASQVWVSAISAWETAMLVSKGRLVLACDVGQWVDQALALPGLRLMGLSPAISVDSTRLPGDLHGDPADRIIAATARHLGAALVTADDRLLTWAKAGHLLTLPV